MAGGIIQLISFGTQDIFLVGNPEITFFKVLYRRYTNFAIESIEEFFQGEIDFGEQVVATLSNNGDLIHKMYLKIVIPEVNLTRNLTNKEKNEITQLQSQSDSAKKDFDAWTAYSDFISRAYRQVDLQLKAENADPKKINFDINKFFQKEGDNLITAKQIVPISEHATSTDIKKKINDIFNEFSNTLFLTEEQIVIILSRYRIAIDQVRDNLFVFHKYYYYDFFNKSEKVNEASVNSSTIRDNFSWIKKLGHYIFDSVEIDIGGDRIEQHISDWVNIWNELSRNINMDHIYNEMIGNVKILTDYSRSLKPEYTLLIPLQFWFCRNNGLALPLVAMRYHNINITVNFAPLTKLIKTDFEEIEDDIENIIKLKNASLFVDYIFLDNDERRKFAQSIHEYLIDQVQFELFEDITQKEISLEIENFEHPIRELIWVVKKQSNIDNNLHYLYGIRENVKTPTEKKIICRTQNSNTVTITLDCNNLYLKQNECLCDLQETNLSEGVPIEQVKLTLNGYLRFARKNGEYFNYVQPWQHHSNTPDDGIFVYSFCLKPEDFQPSGSLNATKINSIILTITLKDEFFSELQKNNDSVSVIVFAKSHNILRVMGGMAGVAFTL